jgi:hypothetical protein
LFGRGGRKEYVPDYVIRKFIVSTFTNYTASVVMKSSSIRAKGDVVEKPEGRRITESCP